MKHIITGLVLLLSPVSLQAQCGPGGCPLPFGRPPESMPQHAVPREITAACVHVRGPRGDMGSGTVIHADAASKTGVVLTCKHVVGDQRTFTITFPDGKQRQGSRHNVDAHADLASILFDADDATPWAALAHVNPERGARLYQIGYPGGRGPNYRFGEVAFYVPSIPVRSMVPTFVAKGGDSGSGVFLAADNTLCGVVWGRDDRRGDQAQVVELKDIKRFCSFLPAQCLPRKPAPKYEPLLPGLPDKQAIAKLAHKVEELGKGLLDLKKALETGGQNVQAGMQALADKLREAEAAILHIKGGGDHLKDELLRIKNVFDKLKNVETFAGTAGTLTAVGAATGGVGVPVILGGWALLTLLRRFRGASLPPTSHVVIRENPPPPQIIREQSTYVPYEAPNAELTAHKLAMDEIVKKYPGARDTIEILKTYTSQLLSGQKK